MEEKLIDLEKQEIKSYRLNLNPRLKVDMEELVFKYFCQDKSFAYISVDKIYRTFSTKNILEFNFKEQSLNITVPGDIADEIWEFCLSEKNEHDKLLFNYNFLIVDLNQVYNSENGYYPRNQNKVGREAFSWVSIDTGNMRIKEENRKYRRSLISEKSFHIEADFPSLYLVDYKIGKAS